MATKTKEVSFYTGRYPNLSVVVEPRRLIRERDITGAVISEEESKGLRAEFVDHTFATDDPKLIKALREHPDFSKSVEGAPERGFFENYAAGRPNDQDIIGQIVDFATRGDAQAIRDLVEEEEAHGDGGRENVLAQAERALTALNTSLEEEEPSSPTDAEEPVLGIGSVTDNEPTPFATKKAEELATKLGVKGEALRVRSERSDPDGYTEAEVRAVAISEGKDVDDSVASEPASDEEVGFASEAAEKLAKKQGVKLDDLGTPSGKSGYTVADVKAAGEGDGDSGPSGD